jgi:hypothetical protein
MMDPAGTTLWASIVVVKKMNGIRRTVRKCSPHVGDAIDRYIGMSRRKYR